MRYFVKNSSKNIYKKFLNNFFQKICHDHTNRGYSLLPSTQFLRVDGVLFQYAEKEAIYYHINDSDAELAAVLDEYIEYYNEVRMHRTLKMKTLSQVETEFFERVNL